jgi:hypothetical protein
VGELIRASLRKWYGHKKIRVQTLQWTIAPLVALIGDVIVILAEVPCAGIGSTRIPIYQVLKV